ncbi:MAG: OmpA family protein [Planctomycetaceae bacterium]
MVEPSWRWRVSWRLALGGLGLGLGLGGLAGCSLVPKSRLDDCHRLSQTLQSENARLKDVTLSLRSQNQDLTQRAVDDARQLKVQGESVRRLEQSVLAYQAERDQLAAAFERMKRDLQVSANPLPKALLERFRVFAEAYPGCAFDPESAVLTIPSATLFEPGTDRLRPEAHALLRSAAERLNDPEARDLDLLVVGHTEQPAVRRAGLAAPGAKHPHLGLDRASRVRDLLAGEGGLDAARIEVAGHEVPPDLDEGRAEETPAARGRRIEIHLRRHGPAPAANPTDP